MILPITVILPTRNAVGTIETHIVAIRDLLTQVEEIVVVDSSEDGTLDFLRETLADLPVRFFSRPRGLYESWNFAIRQATAEFVYFSTMGDTISLAGMEHLLEVARERGVDLVLSPPEMRKANGEVQPDVQWPIHVLCETMRTQDVCAFTRLETFLHSVSYLPATILGSSASNLYRRAFMEENPFPEGWGHCADSAWMVSVSMMARVAVTRRSLACFVLHPKADGDNTGHLPTAEHYEDFFDRAGKALRDAEIGDGEKEVLAAWLAGVKSQREKSILAIEARNRRLHHYEGKIDHLTKRVDTVQNRAKEYEGKLRESNDRIIELRRQVWHFEQAHRSIVRIVGLYLSVKRSQIRKAADWLLRKVKS